MYVQVAFLFGVFVSVAIADLVKGGVSRDGLCTYTFRDVCVSQRMSDVTELRAVVNSLQAQLTLVNKVVAAVPDLRKTLKQLSGKVDKISDRDTPHSSAGGAVYIRWGRKVCPQNGAELLYWGVAAGSHYKHSGGGSNYLCLPRDPEWGKTVAGFQSGGHLYGAEYEIPSSNNPFSKANAKSLHDNDVPCAVCHVASRPSKLMIPAKLSCPPKWTKEYSGYLMAEHYSHSGRTTYVCVDNAPEVTQKGAPDKDGVLFYNIEAACGSLPCPNYVDGWELTCVVCSK